MGTPQLTSVDTNLAAGTYGLGDFGVDIEVTVPDGWVGNASPGLAGVVSGIGTDRETMLLFWRISAIFEDPCALNPPAPTGELTVDEIADGLLGLPDIDVLEASTVQLDGYDARYVEMLAPIDTECNPYRMWLGPDRGCRCMYPEAQHFRLWVLEVDGVPFMIESLDTPAGDNAAGTSPEVLAELDAMVESIDIKPTS